MNKFFFDYRTHRRAPSIRVVAIAVFLLPCIGAVATAFDEMPDEEFVGPLARWQDVQRDFGAVGDGKADDTEALQRALDGVRGHKHGSVLYVPAGTYRLTKSLITPRKVHTDNMVTVVGEDPEKVILKWDGPADQPMLVWDAWYAKISRLTFDGASKASGCLMCGPSFSTYNEISDIFCRDAKCGIGFGHAKSEGQAETEVVRCRFLRCGVGIETVNWNSMDIWIWYCRFEDCERAIHNKMGNWHAWENVFLRSKIADLGITHLMVFSAVNNTSLGSKCFLDFTGGHTWGSPTSITGNRVLDPTGEWAIKLGNSGPYLVVDNVLRIGPKTVGVRMTWGDQTLVGNVYSRENAVEEHGRFRRIDDQVVDAAKIPDALPTLPPTPPRRERKIFEVAPNADGDEIQKVIDAAAKLAGERPVVHLPMGRYAIDRTLVIPAGCDLQVIGDGASEIATRLAWVGEADGLIMRIEGPSRVTVRDLRFEARTGKALLIDTPDEKDGQIFADQLNSNGPYKQPYGRTVSVRVKEFERTSIQFRALQGNGNGGGWLEVLGNGDLSKAELPIAVFTGAAGSAVGQYNVTNGGRLLVRSVFHELSTDALNGVHLTGSGRLAIDATRFSYATSTKSPTIGVDSFDGMFTLATCMLLPVWGKETCRFEFRGNGSGTDTLALNNQFWVKKPGTSSETIWLNKAEPPARGGLVGSNVNCTDKQIVPNGFAFLKNFGELPTPPSSGSDETKPSAGGGVDDESIRRHLSELRSFRPRVLSAAPPGKADIRLHRVFATGSRDATVEIRAAH